jgi:asparagine synthase (glutamine-hydrolysing)
MLRFDGERADASQIHAMTAALNHRGPDGSGQLIDGPVGLGHRRLSIIDAEGGAQPMANEDASVHVVFNGEIYNFVELRDDLQKAGHSFRTRSDTEVIVHAYEQWGPDCLERMNGIFAFAVWDANGRVLFLARDHLGVKPLYFHHTGDRLVFASEVKSLLRDPATPRSVDLTSLAQLFTFRYVPSPRTLFGEIQKLPPGHYMLATSQGVRIARYWNFVPPRACAMRSDREGDLLEEYRALVDDAIRLQLRSDVPVGLFLSSGVDSGSILALMRRRLTGPIHTFTIGFEGGSATNETSAARQLASRFGSDHTEMIVRPDDYAEYYARYMWDLEEPVGNETAAAFYFVSRLARQHVKVVMTGQGVDEPWAGYKRYLGMRLSGTYARLPEVVRRCLIRKTVLALPGNERLKRGAIALDEPDLLLRFAKVYSFFSAEMKADLFRDEIRHAMASGSRSAIETIAHLQRDVQGLDPVSQMLYIDTRASLPDDLLMVNDKTSMANSIEARVPFLDRRIVEFVEALPVQYKLRRATGKYLHKKAAEAWLPMHVVHQRKKGFANPIETWLRGKLRSYVEDCLFSSDSAISSYFNSTYIRRLLELNDQGRENYMRHIYLLISFEMWHRRFIRAG